MNSSEPVSSCQTWGLRKKRGGAGRLGFDSCENSALQYYYVAMAASLSRLFSTAISIIIMFCYILCYIH